MDITENVVRGGCTVKVNFLKTVQNNEDIDALFNHEWTLIEG